MLNQFHFVKTPTVSSFILTAKISYSTNFIAAKLAKLLS